MFVRPEGSADIEGVRCVHEAAFPTAAEADLVDALRAGGRLTLSLVAEEHGVIIGHIAYSPVRFEGAPALTTGLGLGPVAILPEHQRLGKGSVLIRSGLDASRRAGCTCVVVLGDPAYYCRFGFAPASARGLANEYGAGDEFMVLELQPGGLPEHGGLV